MSKFKSQVHIEPYVAKYDSGALAEYIEMHTYDSGDNMLALLNVRGSNADGGDNFVEFWLTPDEVVAIRDGLNQLLEEEE